jgi:hypothetical protein
MRVIQRAHGDHGIEEVPALLVMGEIGEAIEQSIGIGFGAEYHEPRHASSAAEWSDDFVGAEVFCSKRFVHKVNNQSRPRGKRLSARHAVRGWDYSRHVKNNQPQRPERAMDLDIGSDPPNAPHDDVIPTRT